jgi:hypothetical protein
MSGKSVCKVRRICHCGPYFGEAIPKFGWEIASTGKERRFRNDTKQEVATLQTL